MLNNENQNQIRELRINLDRLKMRRRNCSFTEMKEIDNQIKQLENQIKQSEVITK